MPVLLLLLLVESFSWGSRNLTCQPLERDWSLAFMTGIVPAGGEGGGIDESGRRTREKKLGGPVMNPNDKFVGTFWYVTI